MPEILLSLCILVYTYHFPAHRLVKFIMYQNLCQDLSVLHLTTVGQESDNVHLLTIFEHLDKLSLNNFPKENDLCSVLCVNLALLRTTDVIPSHRMSV